MNPKTSAICLMGSARAYSVNDMSRVSMFADAVFPAPIFPLIPMSRGRAMLWSIYIPATTGSVCLPTLEFSSCTYGIFPSNHVDLGTGVPRPDGDKLYNLEAMIRASTLQGKLEDRKYPEK